MAAAPFARPFRRAGGLLIGRTPHLGYFAREGLHDLGIAPILLLDEPTNALDVGRGQQALELVDALRREAGLTVLAAMHDLTLAGQYADRLLLLDGGRVVAAGGADDVLTDELIGRHYGASVRILHDEDGRLVVVPARRG
jgi:iron complex transport system ATP-binding protein